MRTRGVDEWLDLLDRRFSLIKDRDQQTPVHAAKQVLGYIELLLDPAYRGSVEVLLTNKALKGAWQELVGFYDNVSNLDQLKRLGLEKQAVLQEAEAQGEAATDPSGGFNELFLYGRYLNAYQNPDSVWRKRVIDHIQVVHPLLHEGKKGILPKQEPLWVSEGVKSVEYRHQRFIVN